MLKGLWRWLGAAAIISAGVIGAGSFAIAGGGSRGGDGDTPTLAGGAQPLEESEASEQQILLQFDLAYTSRRTAGDTPLTFSQAGELRGEAAGAREEAAQGAHPVRPEYLRYRVAPDRAEPDRAGHAQLGQLHCDERPHRRSRDPAEQPPVHSRRRTGRHLAVRLGVRHVVGQDERPDDAGDRRARGRSFE